MERNIDKQSNIVVLTGAGISAESGLPTFRASDGLWEGHRVEDVATPEAFIRNPAMVHEFYNERRKKLLSADVKPNPAHIALAELEKTWHGEVTIVTQNIDNLHERAGTQNIIHMHGELLSAFCHHCGEKITTETALSTEDNCQACGQIGGVRPDIVWFGEMPYHMEKIAEKLAACDLFLSIGTSGHVYPAAGFVREARYYGAKTIELNLEPSNNASAFEEQIYGPASQTVPALVNKLHG